MNPLKDLFRQADLLTRFLLVITLSFGLVFAIKGSLDWWGHVTHVEGGLVDFLAFYTGGRLLWQDRANLYDLKRQIAIEEAVMTPHQLYGGGLQYSYPPFFTLLLLPLSWLPFSLAYAGGTVLNLICLTSTLRLMNRRLFLNRDKMLWLFTATFGWVVVYVGILQGQTSFLALLLMALHTLDVMDARETRAGVWAGLLIFKPQLCLLPLLLLLWRRCWKGLFSSMLVLTALGLISLALIGITGIQQYLSLMNYLSTFEGALGLHPIAMSNVRALARTYLPIEWYKIGWWGSSALILLVTLWLHNKSPVNRQELSWRWSATVVAILLLSPVSFAHDLVLLILPFALILSAAQKRPSDTCVNWLLALVVGMNFSSLLAAAVRVSFGVSWPDRPLILTGLLLLCVFQSIRARREPLPS